MSYNTFLPEDFELATTKKPYINLGKLAEGEYKFRLVTRPIAGWIDWKDKKPMRFRPKNKPAAAVDPSRPIKPFWAMYVWDYKQSGLFIMEITQNSIRCALEDLAKDEAWGDLTTFDFKIKKSGTGMETNYNVIPVPHKPFDQVIKNALTTAKIRLEALYEGGDPWTDLEPTLNEIVANTGISEAQSAQLDVLLKQINDNSFKKQLEANFHVASIHNIPEQEFARAIRAMEDHIKNKSSKQEKGHGQRIMASVA